MADSGSFASHMSASDELMWTIERDPVLRSTVTAVALLDRVPEWDVVRESVERAVAAIPRLRQRVIVPPVGPPQWVDMPELDLDYHLRRLTVPADRSLEALLDLAAAIAMREFNTEHPLWEFTLVGGVEGGQAALIQKFHHTLTDGVGAMRLAGELFDGERSPSPRPVPAVMDAAPGGWLGATRRGLGDVVAQASRSAAGVVPAAANFTRELVLSPGSTLGASAALLRSVGKLLAPVSEPLSPIMRGRSTNWHFDAFDVDLSALRSAAGEGSVNDAFLAAVAAGMGRYHRRHGRDIELLRMTMPVSIRTDQDPLGGNRFVPVRFALPVDISDPAESMRVLGALSRQWRSEPAVAFTDLLAAALNRLPKSAVTSVFGGMLKNIDFVTTNVPGFPAVVYLGGAGIVREYVFAPPTGAALNVALMSHAGMCCVGVNCDLKAVPDPDVLTACLIEGFEHVLAVAPSASRRAS